MQPPHAKCQHRKRGKDTRQKDQYRGQRGISYVLSLRVQQDADAHDNQVQDHEYPETRQRKISRGLFEKYLANTMIETGDASNYAGNGKRYKQNDAGKKTARA